MDVLLTTYDDGNLPIWHEQLWEDLTKYKFILENQLQALTEIG